MMGFAVGCKGMERGPICDKLLSGYQLLSVRQLTVGEVMRNEPASFADEDPKCDWKLIKRLISRDSLKIALLNCMRDQGGTFMLN